MESIEERTKHRQWGAIKLELYNLLATTEGEHRLPDEDEAERMDWMLRAYINHLETKTADPQDLNIITVREASNRNPEDRQTRSQVDRGPTPTDTGQLNQEPPPSQPTKSTSSKQTILVIDKDTHEATAVNKDKVEDATWEVYLAHNDLTTMPSDPISFNIPKPALQTLANQLGFVSTYHLNRKLDSVVKHRHPLLQPPASAFSAEEDQAIWAVYGTQIKTDSTIKYRAPMNALIDLIALCGKPKSAIYKRAEELRLMQAQSTPTPEPAREEPDSPVTDDPPDPPEQPASRVTPRVQYGDTALRQANHQFTAEQDADIWALYTQYNAPQTGPAKSFNSPHGSVTALAKRCGTSKGATYTRLAYLQKLHLQGTKAVPVLQSPSELPDPPTATDADPDYFPPASYLPDCHNAALWSSYIGYRNGRMPYMRSTTASKRFVTQEFAEAQAKRFQCDANAIVQRVRSLIENNQGPPKTSFTPDEDDYLWAVYQDNRHQLEVAPHNGANKMHNSILQAANKFNCTSGLVLSRMRDLAQMRRVAPTASTTGAASQPPRAHSQPTPASASAPASAPVLASKPSFVLAPVPRKVRTDVVDGSRARVPHATFTALISSTEVQPPEPAPPALPVTKPAKSAAPLTEPVPPPATKVFTRSQRAAATPARSGAEEDALIWEAYKPFDAPPEITTAAAGTSAQAKFNINVPKAFVPNLAAALDVPCSYVSKRLGELIQLHHPLAPAPSMAAPAPPVLPPPAKPITGRRPRTPRVTTSPQRRPKRRRVGNLSPKRAVSEEYAHKKSAVEVFDDQLSALTDPSTYGGASLNSQSRRVDRFTYAVVSHALLPPPSPVVAVSHSSTALPLPPAPAPSSKPVRPASSSMVVGVHAQPIAPTATEAGTATAESTLSPSLQSTSETAIATIQSSVHAAPVVPPLPFTNVEDHLLYHLVRQALCTMHRADQPSLGVQLRAAAERMHRPHAELAARCLELVSARGAPPQP